MKLMKALAILRQAEPYAEPFEIELVCGFTPLHLETFLAAHVQQRLDPGRKALVRTGLYGDMEGNLRRAVMGRAAVAAVFEWPDFDPRLGIRTLGGWGAEASGILSQVERKAALFAEIIEGSPAALPVAVCLPTLPLPPVDTIPGWQSGTFELSLRAAAAGLALRLAQRPGTRVLNAQRLDCISPMAARFDPGSEAHHGFPYSAGHASALAGECARLLVLPPPMKGIVTDLDDTLWSGTVGEVGPDGVHWDLENRSLVHGLYQQMLAALAAQGVLLAAASKNDPGQVDRVFERSGILLGKDRLFPLEIHWGPKSVSVSRVLAAWNVSPGAVIFIDDDPAELAEVKLAHPEVETIQFPKGDAHAVLRLLERLRDLCGKERATEEDRLRLDGLRRRRANLPTGSESVPDAFLESVEAVIRMSYDKDAADPRPLELLNKTNQFNLNGRRVSESEWRERLGRPETVLQVAAYRDKFGSLGRISVLQGRREADRIDVESWVLSCRAFSRRIEFQCLKHLFEHEGASRIRFAFQATPSNGPLQSFLRCYFPELGADLELTAQRFLAASPTLHHRVTSGDES